MQNGRRKYDGETFDLVFRACLHIVVVQSCLAGKIVAP